jgi:tRNA A-37 threonylcarbamoyl transferase component Bud32
MKLIGKYEVIAEIGTGSMGAIYQARDQVLDRIVALKVLRTDTDLDPELKERFYREARACARLAHPNIITVYDLGEAEGAVYIAMELLNGSDLRKLLLENRTPALPVKLDVMAQVCDALEHAHQKQLVHRDVKPSNIFLCDDQRAKVLDFGIARLPTSNLTMAGKVLGSPNYMAPEQIRGGKCDSRSDLFSAAIVFCEFLVHANPFQDEFIPRRIVGSPPDSLRTKDPSIPEPLEALLMRALEKDPEKRIQTAAELGAGLRAVLGRIKGDQTASIAVAAAPVSVPPPPPLLTPPPPVVEAAPPTVDVAEQRVSEFIRAVGDFDEGIAARNAQAARDALEHMRLLATMDDRFDIAVADCDLVLKQTFGTGEKTPPPLPPTLPPPLPREEPSRASAEFVVPPVKPPEIPLPPKAPSVAPPRTGSSKSPIWIVAAAAVIILIGVWWWVRSRSVGSHPKPDVVVTAATAPAIATATVAAATTSLLGAANSSGPVLVALRQGEPVNVIALPASRDQEYTNVRTGAEKAGFVRTADLADWSGADSDAAWRINKLFAPGESATESELVAQLDKWNQYIAKFPAAPQIPEANLESARLHVALLKLAQAAGKPPAEWQSHLDLAKEALGRATGNPTIEAEAAKLAQQLPSAPNQPSTTAQTPQQILRRVYTLWDTGRYKEATRLVDQILAASPGHPEALYWKKKIHDSEEAEAKAQ